MAMDVSSHDRVVMTRINFEMMHKHSLRAAGPFERKRRLNRGFRTTREPTETKEPFVRITDDSSSSSKPDFIGRQVPIDSAGYITLVRRNNIRNSFRRIRERESCFYASRGDCGSSLDAGTVKDNNNEKMCSETVTNEMIGVDSVPKDAQGDMEDGYDSTLTQEMSGTSGVDISPDGYDSETRSDPDMCPDNSADSVDACLIPRFKRLKLRPSIAQLRFEKEAKDEQFLRPYKCVAIHVEASEARFLVTPEKGSTACG